MEYYSIKEEIKFLLVIAIIIIPIIVIPVVLDYKFGYDIEEEFIECEIIHMSSIDSDHRIMVIGEDICQTITVTCDVFNKYEVGDTCIVVKYGHHYPISGNEYHYRIE